MSHKFKSNDQVVAVAPIRDRDNCVVMGVGQVGKVIDVEERGDREVLYVEDGPGHVVLGVAECFAPRAINFVELAREVGELITEKNQAYGSSFAKTGEFFKLLYPAGIKPEQYRDALILARIFDKIMRIATAADAFGESPYRDLAGYALLGASTLEDKR
jgi:hypothetical protein